MAESSLLSRTLWLSVWDWDRFGRNQFLGEVRVALKEFDLSTHIEKWYPLKDKVGGGRGGRIALHTPIEPVCCYRCLTNSSNNSLQFAWLFLQASGGGATIMVSHMMVT